MSGQHDTGLEYLVPRRISQGFECAPGWGLKQVGVVASGFLAGGVVFGLAHLLKVWLPLQLLPLILLGGLGVAVARPMSDGSTMFDFFIKVKKWSGSWFGLVWPAVRKKHLYLYDWSREDV